MLWQYSQTPPPESDSESELVYDYRFTANQFVLATRILRLTTSIFFQLNTCNSSPYVTSSLTREWVWIGLIWLRIRTSGRLLWRRQRTFRFHKMLGYERKMSDWRLLKKGSAPCYTVQTQTGDLWGPRGHADEEGCVPESWEGNNHASATPRVLFVKIKIEKGNIPDINTSGLEQFMALSVFLIHRPTTQGWFVNTRESQ
jgi:hypothetical protein